MSVPYVSGNLNVAAACGGIVLSAPIPGVNVDYVLEQEFLCARASFVPLTLNSVHPVLPSFRLVEETPKADVTGEMCRWTRRYAKIPAPHNQASSIAYSPVGYAGDSVTLGGIITAVPGRSRIAKVVSARVQHDYFLLDPANNRILDCDGNVVFSGANPSPLDVPLLQEHRYYGPYYSAVPLGLVLDTISYGPADPTPQYLYPVPNGTPVQPPYDAYPTRGVYETWVAKSATVKTYDHTTNVLTDTGSYELVATASELSRWMGNILERRTVYIEAE